MSEHEQSGSRQKADLPAKSGKAASAKQASPKEKKSGEVGKALRSVYDSTLNEEVPVDFMDLLGKLG